jgi:hypothetical protein
LIGAAFDGTGSPLPNQRQLERQEREDHDEAEEKSSAADTAPRRRLLFETVNEHLEQRRFPDTNLTSGHHETVFTTLRRFTRPRTALKKCELCGVGLSTEHRHMLEMSKGQIVCACDSCALRFQAVRDGRFKPIPRDVRCLPNLTLTDLEWERLALPINLAFFFHSTPENRTKAMYPSPAGATESLLTLEAWDSLVVNNIALAQMESDVEALLVNRVGTKREYYLAPIDVCFELVGLIRVHWRGLAGGEIVWAEIDKFFSRLQMESRCG